MGRCEVWYGEVQCRKPAKWKWLSLNARIPMVREVAICDDCAKHVGKLYEVSDG